MVASPGKADGAARDRARGPAREEILAAAALCFMDKGFAAASIDDVARRMGATKGRVYHYYASKTDLFFDVYRRSLEMIRDAVAPKADAPGPGAARLAAMTRAHLVALMEQQPFHRCALQGLEMLLRGATTPEQRAAMAELMAMRDAYEGLFRRVLEEGRADGSLRFDRLSVAAQTLLGALNGLVMWYRPADPDDPDSRAALAAEITALVLDGLATRRRDPE